MGYRDHIDDPRERLGLRARAVRDVLAGEMTSRVARRCGVTRQTLHTWVTRHRLGGPEALVPKPRGRSPRRLLAPWQEAQVADAVRLLPPSTVQQRLSRWTRKAVATYAERRFGARLSPWQVDGLLRRHGFGSQKEVRRAFLCGSAQRRAAGPAAWQSLAALAK